jgi:hypothetical protein
MTKTNAAPVSSVLPQPGDLVEFHGEFYRVWKRDQHGNVMLSRSAATCCVRVERFIPSGGHYKIA